MKKTSDNMSEQSRTRRFSDILVYHPIYKNKQYSHGFIFWIHGFLCCREGGQE